MSRGVYVAAAVVLCAMAAGGIVALVVADSNLLEINLAYSAAGLLLFGAVVALTAPMSGRFAWIGWLAAATALATFGVFIAYLWTIGTTDYYDETKEKLTGVLFLWTFALSYSAVALNRLRSHDTRMTTGFTALSVVAAVTVATLLAVAIVGDTGDVTYFRITAVIAVLGTLAAALIPIVGGLRRA